MLHTHAQIQRIPMKSPSRTCKSPCGRKTRSWSPLELINERCGESRRRKGERSRAYFSLQQSPSEAGGKKPRGPHPQINEFTDRRAAERHRDWLWIIHTEAKTGTELREGATSNHVASSKRSFRSQRLSTGNFLSLTCARCTSVPVQYNKQNNTLHCATISKGGC